MARRRIDVAAPEGRQVGTMEAPPGFLGIRRVMRAAIDRSVR